MCLEQFMPEWARPKPVKQYDLYVDCKKATVKAMTEKGKQYMSGFLERDGKYEFSEIYPEDIEAWSQVMKIKLKL